MSISCCSLCFVFQLKSTDWDLRLKSDTDSSFEARAIKARLDDIQDLILQQQRGGDELTLAPQEV